MKRPDFKNITLKEFQNYYWYKSELQEICKNYQLLSSGGKLILKDRLEQLIQNNFDPKKVKSSSANHVVKKVSVPQTLPQSIEEFIPANFTCSELYRTYFKFHIGDHFHFTAYMMQYFKKHPTMTFQEYINEWKAEYERRKNKNYKPSIMLSTQYNQYIRDFFADNKGKTLQDAIICWNYKKDKSGPKIYSRDDVRSARRS